MNLHGMMNERGLSMSIGMGLIEVLVFGIFVSALFSSVKDRQKYGSFKKPRTPVKTKVNTPVKTARVLPQKDLIRSYSAKNKECYEHEVMVSSLDSEKPKRKKSLWNEPSWDDELYS